MWHVLTCWEKWYLEKSSVSGNVLIVFLVMWNPRLNKKISEKVQRSRFSSFRCTVYIKSWMRPSRALTVAKGMNRLLHFLVFHVFTVFSCSVCWIVVNVLQISSPHTDGRFGAAVSLETLSSSRYGRLSFVILHDHFLYFLTDLSSLQCLILQFFNASWAPWCCRGTSRADSPGDRSLRSERGWSIFAVSARFSLFSGS